MLKAIRLMLVRSLSGTESESSKRRTKKKKKKIKSCINKDDDDCVTRCE